jgi:hypothetical protein
MSLTIVVEISKEAIEALRKLEKTTSEVQNLLDIIHSYRLSIRPLHGEVNDPLANSLFYIESPEDIAKQVREDIIRNNLVITAYLKPKAEAPHP